ncbi:MAG: spondin domain-containing protein [Phycisphaerae bacterium]|nr:spondin domain-containing protein [Phycisphaerae bacterium]
MRIVVPNAMHFSRHSRSWICTSLVVPALLGSRAFGDTATYQLTVDVTWSEVTHPGLFPPEAHFSWHGGATHSAQTGFWQVGALASPGMVQMAEVGATITLLQEVQAQIDAGLAGSKLNWPWWFCPADTSHAACGEHVVTFEINDEFPLVTLVSMLGPSPDWFVGVSGLSLRSDGQWLKKVLVDLHPYDGGTRSANVFQLFGPLTIPPEPISLITEESSQLVTPESLGTYTFTLLTPPCPADLDQSGEVNAADLGQFLGNWGGSGIGDLNGDGIVGAADLGVLLGAWGPCG